MGNASLSQKITQLLFDAASSVVRRTRIWDKFQVFVQRIKDAIGFGQKQITVLQTGASSAAKQDSESPAPSHQPSAPHSQAQVAVDEPSSERSDTSGASQAKNHEPDVLGQQPNAQDTAEEDALIENINSASGETSPSACLEPSKNTEPNSGSNARKDEGHGVDGRRSDARDATGDDILVENITRALEDANPRLSSNLGASEQPDFPGPAAGGFENTKTDSVPSASKDENPAKAEPQPVFSVHETYESRVEKVDAVYSRVVPESGRPPKPKANRGDPIDDYDNQVAERNTGIAFQPPVYIKLENNIVQTNADLESTSSPADPAAAVPGEGPFEPEVEATFVNYRTWDRELYSELPLNRFSIRLVRILSGKQGSDVSVRMDVHPLDEVAMKYEALSYVWGKSEPAKEIFVNEVEVSVNPNLYDALISLRQHDSERSIWIDAICLNQNSVAERSKEVQKMGKIYSLAKTVNVFLGAPSPSNSTFINSFLKFLNRDDEGQAANRYAEEGLRGLDRICAKCETDVRDVCKGFVEACLQPWWGRIWTLQEFYLAEKEPMWYWGRAHASNASLKRDFSLLTKLLWDLFTREDANGRVLSDVKTKIAKPISSFKVDVERIWALISRRYRTAGFDTPRRLYRELTARATDPRDFVYGLRAIFDPVFGRCFVPDYQMRTELLFACLAVFLIQFECWGDVLWWYPSRYAAGKGLFPSWLPNFTQRIVPHELDVQPLDQAAVENPEPKLVVLNHRLHAEGYNLDKVYAHRHLDKSDGEKIFQELWQFDHCMNNNHECHEYFDKGAAPEDLWLRVFLDMYESYYAKWTFFNSAFRGALLQSTMKLEDRDKLPRQVAECMPCWDLLQWHALRIATPGLSEALGHDIDDAGPGYLENIISPRMGKVFRKAFADFFIGACVFDWDHLSIWLNRFPNATQWFKGNNRYWSEIHESLPGDTEKRAKAIADAYGGYEAEISSEVMRVSWCYSFYYTFLAYVILLDCDDHANLASIILKLQMASDKLRSIYFSTTPTQIEELASTVPSIATRVSHRSTVIDLFRGRYLLWTDGGFRGISCPGVETCCDNKSIVAIIDGLSFPVIVRDYNEETGEGWLAGCALIRGVDMLNRDTESTTLPPDYKRGGKRIFKLR